MYTQIWLFWLIDFFYFDFHEVYIFPQPRNKQAARRRRWSTNPQEGDLQPVRRQAEGDSAFHFPRQRHQSVSLGYISNLMMNFCNELWNNLDSNFFIFFILLCVHVNVTFLFGNHIFDIDFHEAYFSTALKQSSGRRRREERHPRRNRRMQLRLQLQPTTRTTPDRLLKPRQLTNF